MVDRRVGLDGVVDREVVGRGHLAVQGADDAGGDRLLETEGTADGDDVVADGDLPRIAERQGEELRRRRVHLEDSQVGRGIGSDDLGLVGLAVPELDRNGLGAVDDVLVRDDVAVGVVDKARPLCLRRAAEGIPSRRDGDLDDALARQLVDRVHR